MTKILLQCKLGIYSPSSDDMEMEGGDESPDIQAKFVHGTWVCGKRVKPRVFVLLKEDDTVKIGSSHLYELHWVSINTLSDVYTDEKDDACSLDDDMEGLEFLRKSSQFYA
ncbi:FHA domain-containing protein PS1 [Tanacetum coccineum]